jgi:drug/metabolite transporter (DMT)-like permease
VTRLAPYLCLNLACVFWAGNMVIGRALRGYLGPGLIVSVRGVMSAVLLAVLVRVLQRGDEPPLREDFWRLCFMAFSGVAGFQGLFYLGLRYTDAINAALMNAAGPLVSLALAFVVLRTAVRPVQWLGALVSLGGIAVILSGGSLERLARLHFNGGDLLLLLSMVLWAAYSIAGRAVMQRRSVLSVTAITSALSLLMVAPWGLWECATGAPRFTPQVWQMLAFIAVFVGVGALLAWNAGVKAVGAAEAMAFMNMTPVYTVLLSTLLLHEPMRLHQATGAVLVVGGSLLAALGPQWLQRPAPGAARQAHG